MSLSQKINMTFIDTAIDVCHWMALAARVVVEIWCQVTDRRLARSLPRPPPPPPPPPANHDVLMLRLSEHHAAAKAMRDSDYADEAEHERLKSQTESLWDEIYAAWDSMPSAQAEEAVETLFDASVCLSKACQEFLRDGE